ncbi:response regulator [Paenibacillus flagellatus]|uniref:DNA-binding response regulator n=1 Tax=Paenibacillus flagellatus TaxID=2211139 RepID=A0A2V5KE81_9BACL|nr:response regulator [Paenibacillus flagellatus]PYI56373.1 hypothetical protein DLM86_05175 [Paenibacillus flagellatus]
MLKVMIVDDEALVRIGIKSCIEWEKYDMEFVGQAEDGVQALELIDAVRPDIVLTDILMPNMDGLELIGEIAARHPRVKTIVLSCHNEMDAVKKAMKLGAEDYILKLSMKPETILDILIKVKAEVEKERLQQEEKLHFESVLRANKQVIKNGLYKKLMSGSISYDEFWKESSVMQVQPAFADYLVVHGTIDNFYDAPAKSRLRDSHLLSASFQNILMEGLSEFAKAEFAELDEGEYVMLLDGSAFAAANRSLLSDLLRKMNVSLERYLNITVTFAVAGKTDRLQEVPALYGKAKTTCMHRFYRGKACILFADSVPDFVDKEIVFDLEEEKRLEDYIRAGDGDGVKSAVDRFFESGPSAGVYHPMRVKTAVLNVMYVFKKVLKPYEQQLPPLDGDSGRRWTDLVLEAETLTDIRHAVDEYVADSMQAVAYAKGQAARPEIASIKRYVYENIDRNISLDDASKFSNMSRSYFSFLFKKEIGESFTHFVNRTKMEKAKDYIMIHNLKVYEAAEKVGIRDEAYFSKLFKKYIGVNPGKIKGKG